VPPDARAYFQRALERNRKDDAAQAKERLDREAVAAEGNNPVRGNYDEEAKLQRALKLSRASQMGVFSFLQRYTGIELVSVNDDLTYLVETHLFMQTMETSI
jgi:predicted ATPase